jgi:hypothetical protein
VDRWPLDSIPQTATDSIISFHKIRDFVYGSGRSPRDGNYPVLRGTFIGLDGKGLLLHPVNPLMETFLDCHRETR